jgi:glycosyltransferase involved in cell wall biosynthesis
MRVSLINLNLIDQDAIGQCLLHQLQFFRRRGDLVQIFTVHPPQGVSGDALATTRVVTADDLVRDPHFVRSDLYVYHYPGRHPLMESIKTLERGAVIFYFHNVTPPALWNRAKDHGDLKADVEGVRVLAPFADLLVADSEFNARDLVEVHGCDAARVRILPLAAPVEHFHPGPADPALVERYRLSGRRVLLFVGRVASHKRVDLLVEALPLVQRETPNTTLLIVGDNDSNPAFREVVAAIRRRAKALGVADSVVFTGRVDELPPFYRLADVYTSASLHEGFGVPLIEAMASGLPVVASSATSHPWVLGDAGLLAEPENVADLAAQISKVLTDDGLYGALGQRSLARAKEFTLENYFFRWEKMVAEATTWLPNRPYPYSRLPSLEDAHPSAGAAHYGANATLDEALESNLHHLALSANTMMRDYVVASRLPLVGPLISWLRRNLTSHLREPYLDPILNRQENFNRLAVDTMHALAVGQAQRQSGETAEQHTDAQTLEIRLAHLEQRLGLLSQLVLLALERDPKPADAEELGRLREQLAQLQQGLPTAKM